MTGLELYIRFMITLAVGICGCGVAMTTLFETILRDWDPAQDLRRWWRVRMRSRSDAADIQAEDLLGQLHSRRVGVVVTPGERRYESSLL